ncbi:MAG: shikimate kinase [Actinomycetota bacterium]|nr:shikimate kinase [Actinomycetota bacterium]
MKSIALIGFMGSGKSTVGPLLARRQGRPFFDLDSIAERLSGKTVSEVFSGEGESGWRLWESRALAEVVEEELPFVLACGGGVVLDAKNRDILRQRFLTIYLDVSEAVLIERLRRNKGRPLLAVAEPEAAIAALLKARRALYEAAAHLIIETDLKNPTEVADEAQTAVAKLTGA